MKILALIPARSGSKSIPHKNIRLFNQRPMLSYSIEHAKKSRYINRIIVSTDSEAYGNIAKEYGAEVPFLRPKEFASDTSTDYEVFYHCLTYLRDQENYCPDVIVHLRPTYPIRNVEDIDAMIELLLNNKNADSIRSMALAKEIPYKMWLKEEDGRIKPLITEIPECYNMPRQKLPSVYYQNACIDVLRPKNILELHSMTGNCILGYEMHKNYDIDTEEEFQRAEEYAKLMEGKKRFVFDIDGVIAKIQPELDYAKAQPNKRMIQIINQLYQMGNYIVVFTARGYVTKIDWREVTEKQLKEWGLCYHELHFGKPNADYYIDDKMLALKDLYEIFELDPL